MKIKFQKLKNEKNLHLRIEEKMVITNILFQVLKNELFIMIKRN